MLVVAGLVSSSLLTSSVGDAASSLPSNPAPASRSAPISLNLSITAASDYRSRGISLSDRKPVIQPSLTASTPSGFHGSLFASTLGHNESADAEVGFVFGYTRELGGSLSMDVSGTYYAYPGSRGYHYYELSSRTEAIAASGKIGFAVVYAPSQKQLGYKDNVHASMYLTHPITRRMGVSASVGVENGAFGDWKTDWNVGLTLAAANYDISVSYVDTARSGRDPAAAPGAILSVGRKF